MSFDINKYRNLIQESKFKDAEKYRICNVPEKMYKFIYINEFENPKLPGQHGNLNDIKINSLEEKMFWLSTRRSLNDPFELRTLYIDENKIRDNNYPVELAKELQLQYLDGFLIGCFTIENNLINSMPMWAHYANNHRGFCVEYTITKPELFFPISYEDERAPANVHYMNALNLIIKDMNSQISEGERQKLEFYNSLLFHNSTIKHKSWKYETYRC